MEKFAAVFKKVQKINKAIIGAVLLLMIGVVFLQTFCRFVIFKSLTWSEELTIFCLYISSFCKFNSKCV